MAITRYGNSMDPFDQMFNTLLGSGGSAGRGSLMRSPETDVVETERARRRRIEVGGSQGQAQTEQGAQVGSGE